MAGPGPEAPAAGGPTPPGAGGSGGAQILQQIEGLLMQLAQAEPEPQIQQGVQQIAQQVEALQPMLAKDDEQDMQSGLANPSGGGGMPPGGGEEEPPAGSGGGEHHVVEVHIGVPAGGPKTFAGAKKAAMATHAERGHFDSGTPKGETPSTPRTKNKAKG